MKNRLALSVGLTLALLAAPGIASAAPITYTVDNVFSNFSVTGTITTNGDLGTLDSADITGFNLVLTNTGNMDTDTLTNLNSTATIAGTGVTATASGLFYDYVSGESNSTYDYLFFYGGSDGFSSLCYQSSGCYTFNGTAYEGVFIPFGGGNPTAAQSGDVEIASVGSVAPTPEPSSLVLLGTGLLGVAGVARRKFFAA